MRSYLAYLLRRIGQFVLVVFIGVNITFFITHATPIDPVEQTIAASTSFGSTSPEAIALMRQSLRELYGLEGLSVKADGSMVFIADGGRGESVPYNRIRSVKM